MDNIFLHITQSNDKKFHYNIKRGYQYLVSAYDSFKTYNEANFEGLKILNNLKNK